MNILFPISGTIVDKLNKKKILVISDLLSGALMITFFIGGV